MKKRISFLFGIALIIGVATIVLAAVTWKTVVWTAPFGSIAVNIAGDMEVTISSCYTTSCWGTAHYNTPGYFRAAATPWVKITFLDSGPGTPGLQIWMEDEEYVYPTAGAWTQFGAWQREGFDNYQIYWWDFDTDLKDDNILNDSNNSWGWVDTGIERTTGMHTLKLAMRDNGIVDYWFDGVLIHSSTDITPNYFGDIYLAGHSDPSNPNETVIFTDYETGIDYVPFCVPPPSGLVSWWPGDGDANDIADGNDGTLNGATYVPGKVDQAFSFDGVDDNVSLGTTQIIGDDTSFTIDAWIKVNSFSADNKQLPIYGEFSDGTRDTKNYLAVGNLQTFLHKRVFFDQTPPGWGFLESNILLTPGRWYHVAYTQDGITRCLYIDGTLDNSDSAIEAYAGQEPDDIRIGGGGGLRTDQTFDGLIDEVEIFNRALTASEIQDIYLAGSAGKCKYIEVDIDIKPGSDPNSINLSSAGVISVAILSTLDFNAPEEVDPATVSLAGAKIKVAGKSGKFLSHAEDVDGDGLLDLVCQVLITEDLAIELGETSAVLEALTYDGQSIRGEDTIRIIPDK